MDAIEFKTTIRSDGTIKLPEEYKNFSTGQVKVIMLKDNKESPRDKVTEQYQKLKSVIDEIQDR